MVNTELLAALETLEARLTALGAPVVEHFNPPLQESVVSEARRSCVRDVDPEIASERRPLACLPMLVTALVGRI